MTAVADTSFVVAVGNSKDQFHSVCKEIYLKYRLIWLPQSTLAEVTYMLGQRIKNRGVAQFLYGLPESRYRLMPLDLEDVFRAAELLEKYADTRIDFVDATIVAIAERLRISHILTLDQRDFRIVRPRHVQSFDLLPSLET